MLLAFFAVARDHEPINHGHHVCCVRLILAGADLLLENSTADWLVASG